MVTLSTNVLGTFALKNGRVIKWTGFGNEPTKIASKLMEAEKGVCKEEIELLRELEGSGIKTIRAGNPSRFQGLGLGMDFIEDKGLTDPLDIASEVGIPRKEVLRLLKETNSEISKYKLRQQERDQMLIQAVNSLDDVEEVKNRLLERLREWYSLYHPELAEIVKNGSLYALIASGDVDNPRIDKSLAGEVERTARDSLGMPFSREDLDEVRRLADAVLKIDEFESDTEEYIGGLMKEMAPSTAELAGPLLGARLISIAGGMERLSKLPASTIQILGAEESFFRFLKTGKLPPKHGIIFQLPEIRSAPQHLRGKISRNFAAKIALTAKSDYFGGSFIGPKLRADFLKNIEDLKKQKKKPKKINEPRGGPGRMQYAGEVKKRDKKGKKRRKK